MKEGIIIFLCIVGFTVFISATTPKGCTVEIDGHRHTVKVY